jgi:hypothetical protein
MLFWSDAGLVTEDVVGARFRVVVVANDVSTVDAVDGPLPPCIGPIGVVIVL